MFSISRMIDETWMEPVYDHVHHGRCLSLLEQARLDLLASIGQPNDRLLRDGLALVITRIEVDYKREIKQGMVSITCDAGELSGRVIVLHQQVINERGKVAVSARVESMFMSAETRRGIEIPQGFVESFQAWVAKGSVA